MAWDHLDFNRPHLAYMILGGFTSLFMLCSLFVKEKLYIGEATVATLCGIIFGPHAANLFNPLTWGNVDKITLEASRIVLVVQCFAVGVELPKAYMERHWRSVVVLLVPVMTWGWLATSLFIWWMVPTLNWLESLICAACVTATDPVLASSVVGKGKFSKRVPKHLRDLLSAESGCNDGMAFPFIYLSYYILYYKPNAGEVSLHWFCVTILYECVFGATYGFLLGYIARHAIKFAERKQLIDRESFLVFYFVLALFCAGSGSSLGMDDLLIGFAAGVGFSNDGWFTEKTEESHVSNVIDLLLNLAYFVYFGSIIPWDKYNAPDLGLVPWRLVVIAILVIFFRRIPIMLLLKPFIPDIKSWREALFAGHFGPIGVGAVFASILARAELEHHRTEPLSPGELPKPGEPNYYIVQVIWPLTTFIIISSILVHGSSIAVFTLGKHINTLTLTLSYTTANDEGPSWMNRLPRVHSISRGSLSFRKAEDTSASSEKLPVYPPDSLPPVGVPGNFLRRVRNEDADSQSLSSSRKPLRRRKADARHGGPISQSAILPLRRAEFEPVPEAELGEAKSEADQRDRIDREGSPPSKERDRFGREPEMEIYREGNQMVIEDAEGNVLRTKDTSGETLAQQQQDIREEQARLEADRSGSLAKSKSQPHCKTEGEEIQRKVSRMTGLSSETAKKRLGKWFGQDKERAQKHDERPSGAASKRKRSAHAYQFGNTIILEDEDGEVIRKYTIPSANQSQATGAGAPRPFDLAHGIPQLEAMRGRKEKPESSQAVMKRAFSGDDIDADDDSDDGDSDEDSSLDANNNIASSLGRLRAGRAARTRHSQSDKSQSPRPLRRRDSDDDGTERIPPSRVREAAGGPSDPAEPVDLDENFETPAERKRRLAALGELDQHDASDSGSAPEQSDSDDNGDFRAVRGKVQFADGTRPAERKTSAGLVGYGNGNSAESNSMMHGDDAPRAAMSGAVRGGGESRHGPRPHVSWAESDVPNYKD